MGKKHFSKMASVAENTTGAENRRMFHYTVGWERIGSILTSKVILREFPDFGVKVPVAWFSTNPKWENTVKKGIGPSAVGLEYYATKYGAFRIEVRRDALELHSWDEHVKSGKESKAMIRGMLAIGKSYGAKPSEWYGCYSDVPVNEQTVVGVGIYHDGEWYDMPLDAFMSQYQKELDGITVELLTPDDVVQKESQGYRRSPAMDETLRLIAEEQTDKSFAFCSIGKVIHCIETSRFVETEDGGVALN